jgi:hypothetical protein
MATKICRECNIEKDVVEFGPQKDGKDGLHQKCRACALSINKLWNEKNPERRKELDQRYIAKNAHRIKERHLLKHYKITLKQYSDMLERQGGCCALCGTHQKNLSQDLCVDHCHIGGRIRELLCQRCNRRLGHGNDDPQQFRKDAEYLEKHQEQGDVK